MSLRLRDLSLENRGNAGSSFNPGELRNSFCTAKKETI